MTIKNLVTNVTGLVNVHPRIDYLDTDDFLATVIKPGYVNNSPYLSTDPIFSTDFLFVTFKGSDGKITQNLFFPQFNGNLITLVPYGSGSSSSLIPPLNLVGQGTILLNGTVAVTNGSPTVTGTGTTFTSLTAGQSLIIFGVGYTILNIANDTTLTLQHNYAGVTISGYIASIDDNFINLTTYAGANVLRVNAAGNIINSLQVRPITPGGSGAINTILPSDDGGVLVCNNSATGTFLSIPTVSATNYAPGFNVTLIQSGSGTTSFFVSGDSLLQSNNSATLSQGCVGRLKLISVNSSNVGIWSLEISGFAPVDNSSSFVMGGPWTGNNAANMSIMLNNNMVIMEIRSILSTISGDTNTTNIASLGTLATKYRPITRINGLLTTVQSGSTSAVGSVFVDTTGIVTICSNPNFTSSWSGTSGVTTVGFQTFSLTWLVNA